MLIAIDSAHQKRYTGVASGQEYEINSLYNAISGIFAPLGIKPPYHWSKISSSAKARARPKFIETLHSHRINFNIFEHRLGRGAVKKDFFLNDVPKSMSPCFVSWLRDKIGSVNVLIDDDYNMHNVPNGTKRFLENFIRYVSCNITGKDVRVLATPSGAKAVIKHSRGQLVFNGFVANAKAFREIQVIDLVLGYYVNNPKEFEKVPIYFRRI